MDQTVPLPDKFLQTPGEPPVPWKDWKRAFKTCLIAKGATGADFPEERKIALLITCLGTEGQRIFHSIHAEPTADNPETLEGIYDLLEAQFGKRQNVVAARVDFMDRGQLPGESINIWVAALRQLVTLCNYRDRQDEEEHIRDVIVAKTCNPKVRERLLMEQNLTLDKALTIARNIEQAATDAMKITKAATTPLGSTASLHRFQGTQRRKPPMQASQRSQLQYNHNNRSTETCTNCGHGSHRQKDPQCPALNAICNSCGKKGHFERVCRSTQSRSGYAGASPSQESRNGTPGSMSGHVDYKTFRRLQDDEDDEPMILKTTEHGAKTTESVIRISIGIRNAKGCEVPVRMIVDTGSTNTVIPKHMCQRLFPGSRIDKSAIRAHVYGKQSLSIHGVLRTEATYQGQTVPVRILVAETGPREEPLLGLDLIRAFGFRLMNSNAAFLRPGAFIARMTEEPTHAQLSDHRTRRKDNTKPASQRRRSPLALIDQTVNYTVEHKPGRENAIADALSRLPVSDQSAFRSAGSDSGLNRCVEHYVSSCSACQMGDKSATPAKPPLQPVSVPSEPWTQLALDIAGPYASVPPSQRYLIVLQDYTSKWPEVAACGSITSSSVIKFLTGVFSRHGLPLSLVTDNGPQFISQEFKQYLRDNNIEHRPVAVYNPMANGMVERLNRVIKEGTQVAVLAGDSWTTGLQKLLIVYRSTSHTATGKTTFEMLDTSWKDRLEGYQARYKDRADDKSAQGSKIAIGDLVRHRLPHAPKGHPLWSQPLRVREKRGDASFLLEDGKIWHSRNLSPFHGSHEILAGLPDTDASYLFPMDRDDPNGPIGNGGQPDPRPPIQASLIRFHHSHPRLDLPDGRADVEEDLTFIKLGFRELSLW